jgi:D-serine dehydratase
MAITDDWTIDWRHKGFPASPGVAASCIEEQRWHVDEHLMTPIAALTHSALVHNAMRMQGYCDEQGVRLAPHGKTTMSPELVHLQMEHGAWGVTAATTWQARVLATFGVRRILIANECVDPVGLQMLTDLLRELPDLEVATFVDSIAAVESMGAALRGLTTRPFPVLVEVGATAHRAGARDVATAVEVGRAVVRTPELALAGVGCFEGVLGGHRTQEVLASVQQLLSKTRQVAQILVDDNAFRPDHPIILTAGGSAFFDQVVEVLAAGQGSWSRDVEVVIRPGCYLTHDDGTYQASTPFAGSGAQEFRPALHVWSRVLSTPEPGLAIIDAGKRRLVRRLAARRRGALSRRLVRIGFGLRAGRGGRRSAERPARLPRRPACSRPAPPGR